jgi:hypothetical protein
MTFIWEVSHSNFSCVFIVYSVMIFFGWSEIKSISTEAIYCPIVPALDDRGS